MHTAADGLLNKIIREAREVNIPVEIDNLTANSIFVKSVESIWLMMSRRTARVMS